MNRGGVVQGQSAPLSTSLATDTVFGFHPKPDRKPLCITELAVAARLVGAAFTEMRPQNSDT